MTLYLPLFAINDFLRLKIIFFVCTSEEICTEIMSYDLFTFFFYLMLEKLHQVSSFMISNIVNGT